jgi:predicted lipoprotein with Yx(FWY)xxD motif
MAIAQTGLGSILVGPAGMTLYMFLPDTSTTSACTGSCASLWPPLTGTLPSLGAGLSASDFGSLTRSDGAKQVTFHGHPLYYYSGDKVAGNTNGQGLLSKWYVLGADGNPIK